MSGIFEEKNIKPMLISEQTEPFNAQDWIYEIKLDGIRCIAYLDDEGTDLRNKRDKKLLPHVPELAEIHKQVSEKCILDGELLILKDGKVDFYEIQQRVLMTNPFKIRLASNQYPASFVAYDILYFKNQLITDLPLMERKKILQDTVRENDSISIWRYIEEYGVHLFQAAKAQGLEGIVAKKMDSRYHCDKRTKNWIKCKVMQDVDCIICGYIPKENNMTSLILGLYDDEQLVYKGHVTLGVSFTKLSQYGYKEMDDSPFGYVPPGNENAVWLYPELVCIVESMPTEKNYFRQPVFKGIREDKKAEECTLEQML